MTKTIAIIAGEPNSISSEIIFKIWKLRKKYKHNSLIVIGSSYLFNLQNYFIVSFDISPKNILFC